MAFHDELAARYAAQPEWLQTLINAAAVLVVGVLAVLLLKKWTSTALGRAPRVDDTVRAFLTTVVGVILWVFLAVAVLGTLGVDTAALVGGLAIGGFIVGFAVKDALGNLAAGVMLLFYRPFKVGEVAKVGSETGMVVGLSLGMTTLRTGDARIVTVPNGQALGSEIINLTREPRRRAEVDVGISYDDDIDVAMKAVFDALAKDERVLADPAPQIWVTELGDNSVNLSVRAWVETKDIWSTLANLRIILKKAVEAAGCTIPFPQRDVHFYPTTAVPIDTGGNGGRGQDRGRTREATP